MTFGIKRVWNRSVKFRIYFEPIYQTISKQDEEFQQQEKALYPENTGFCTQREIFGITFLYSDMDVSEFCILYQDNYSRVNNFKVQSGLVLFLRKTTIYFNLNTEYKGNERELDNL